MFKDLLISIGIGIMVLVIVGACVFGLFKLIGVEVVEGRTCNCCGCQVYDAQDLD